MKYQILIKELQNIEELNEIKSLNCNGGSYSPLGKVIYEINYAVYYVAETLSQGVARGVRNLEQTNNNTLYGHSGAARR